MGDNGCGYHICTDVYGLKRNRGLKKVNLIYELEIEQRLLL